MTERELRRTALIIPPRGRAVLCCWAAIPGLLAAPFVFWQSLPAGVVFCLLWAALVAVVYQRACSYAAALGAETLTVYSGIAFPLRRARRAVSSIIAGFAVFHVERYLRTIIQRYYSEFCLSMQVKKVFRFPCVAALGVV